MSGTQLTLTVSPELGRYVQDMSEDWSVKKSVPIGRALEDHRGRHTEALLREGYQEMAEQDLALHKEFEHVDRETPLPEWAEE